MVVPEMKARKTCCAGQSSKPSNDNCEMMSSLDRLEACNSQSINQSFQD